MNFLIKQNATLPEFIVEIYKDGRSDFRIFQILETSNSVYLNLRYKGTSELFLSNLPCTVSISESELDPNILVYSIQYQFNKVQTSTPGEFTATITIENEQGIVLFLYEASLISPS